MWIHVTLLGLLQGVVGAALLPIHVLALGAVFWFLSGTPREQRTPSDWFGHFTILAAVALVDAAYLWWLQNSLRTAAGVVLVIMTLGTLKLMLGFFLEDDRADRTPGRWARRLAVVSVVALLDAAWLDRIPASALTFIEHAWRITA